MNRMIRLSCIESMHYTGKQNHSRKRRSTEKRKYRKAKCEEATKDTSRASITGMEKCDKREGRICADGAVTFF